MDRIRNIKVVPYDPGWAQAFQAEAARLTGIFGVELLTVHHIGSTSVPGLVAKPIIDMMPLVPDIERVEAFNPRMISAGYLPMGEFGIPDRRFFIKGGDVNRTHHVHLYEPDNPEVARHLDFRDYLRVHPDATRRYGALKIELARQYPHDIQGYMAGKDALIKELIAQAQAWRRQEPGFF